MQLREEATPRSAVLWLVGSLTCPWKELEQASIPAIDLNWLFYGCGYRPSLSVQMRQDLELIGDVRERLIRGSAYHQVAASELDKPVLVVQTTQIANWCDAPSLLDGARNLRWGIMTMRRLFRCQVLYETHQVGA